MWILTAAQRANESKGAFIAYEAFPFSLQEGGALKQGTPIPMWGMLTELNHFRGQEVQVRKIPGEAERPGASTSPVSQGSCEQGPLRGEVREYAPCQGSRKLVSCLPFLPSQQILPGGNRVALAIVLSQEFHLNLPPPRWFQVKML